MSEIVFVRSCRAASSTRYVYHTDPDCARLSPAEKVVEVDRSDLFDDRRECSFCAGEVDLSANDRSHYQALQKAAAEHEGSA